MTEDDINGLLYETSRIISTYQEIELMIKLPYRAQIMGAKGRDKVENEFRQEIVCDLYIDVIKDVDWASCC